MGLKEAGVDEALFGLRSGIGADSESLVSLVDAAVGVLEDVADEVQLRVGQCGGGVAGVALALGVEELCERLSGGRLVGECIDLGVSHAPLLNANVGYLDEYGLAPTVLESCDCSANRQGCQLGAVVELGERCCFANVGWVFEVQADRGVGVAKYCGADEAWVLVDDDEGQAELASLRTSISMTVSRRFRAV